MAGDSSKDLERSYFDVLGLCCSSEVQLIDRILKPLEGVHHVSVIVPTRTVIFLHNVALISQLQIVKSLNWVWLEENVRMKGEQSCQNKWPSPFVVWRLCFPKGLLGSQDDCVFVEYIKMVETRASHRAAAVMSTLLSIAPQTAVLANTGEEVSTKEVIVNTRLAVKGGTMIPIDGVVVDGNRELEEKALIGESFPVSKQVDSNVRVGTVNLNGTA
ncbi:putative translocase [Helianthus annuus]|nr:putative translocase [Helianthus annuus]KAJ0870239.1 putative translocase [Helianthus annuus]